MLKIKQISLVDRRVKEKNIFLLPLLATWVLGTAVMVNPGALGGAIVPFPCDLELFRSGLGWEWLGPCEWECPGP